MRKLIGIIVILAVSGAASAAWRLSPADIAWPSRPRQVGLEFSYRY